MNILKLVGKNPVTSKATTGLNAGARRTFSQVLSKATPETKVSASNKSFIKIGPRKNRKLYSHWSHIWCYRRWRWWRWT